MSMKVYRLSDNTELPLKELKKIGVLTWHFDPNNYKAELDAIRAERNYNFEDTCTIHREKLENYDEKLKTFFEEHIHRDEEIRFFLEGSGFFDVRDSSDEWLRIHAFAGDLIVLPAGIYHRYSPDEKNYSKVLRLFCGEPVWTPYNRSAATDKDPARVKYVKVVELMAEFGDEDDENLDDEEFSSGSEEESGSGSFEASESEEEEKPTKKRKQAPTPAPEPKRTKK